MITSAQKAPDRLEDLPKHHKICFKAKKISRKPLGIALGKRHSVHQSDDAIVGITGHSLGTYSIFGF